MKKQLKAIVATDTMIENEAKKAGPQVVEEFHANYAKLEAMYRSVKDSSGEELAGFLFAYAKLANTIARENNIKQ